MAGPGGKEVGRLAIKVLPDTSSFSSSLKKFLERMERQLKVEIPVELNTAGALQDAVALKNTLEGVLGEVNVGTDLNTGGVKAAMGSLLVQLRTMTRLGRPTIRPDVDTGRAVAQMAVFNAASLNAGSAVSNIGRQILLWGPLIFIAASLIAAIGPSLATLLPMVAGLGIGIGVIVMGWEQVRESMRPITQAFGAMRKEIGDTLVKGLQPLIDTFAKTFVPVMKAGLLQFAALINSAAVSMFTFLNSAEGLQLVGTFMTGLALAMRPFAALLAPLTEVFLRLSIAALPALELMGDALLRITTAFAEWLTFNDISGVISESMADLGQILVLIGDLIAGLFPPLFAAAPAVIAFLGGFAEAMIIVLNALTPAFEWMGKNAEVMRLLGFVVLGAVVAFGIFAAGAAILAAGFSALVGAIVGGLTYLYVTNETFRDIANTVFRVVGAAAVWLWGVCVDAFNAIADFVTGTLIPAWIKIQPTVVKVLGIVGEKLVAFWGIAVQVFDVIAAAVVWVGGLIGTIFTAVAGFIDGTLIPAFNRAWPTIQLAFEIIGNVLSVFWTVAQGIFALIAAAIEIVVAVIQALWPVAETVFSGIGLSLQVLWGVFSTVFNTIFNLVSVLLSVIAPITGFFAGVFSSAGGAVRGLIGAFTSMVSGVIGAVGSVISGIEGMKQKVIGVISSIVGQMFAKGKAIVNGLADGIKAAAGAVGDAISGVASKITGFLPGSPVRSGPLRSWNRGGAGRRLVGTLVDGIEAAAPAAAAAMGRLASDLDMAAYPAATFGEAQDSLNREFPNQFELGERSLAAITNNSKDVADRAIQTRQRHSVAQRGTVEGTR